MPEVHFDAARAQRVQRIGKSGERALPQQVHLDQPQRFDGVHVVLGDDDALGGQLQRRQLGERRVRDHRAAGMDAQVARRLVQAQRHIEHRAVRLFLHRQPAAFGQRAQHLAQLVHRAVRQAAAEVVQLLRVHAEHLAHLAHRQARLHGDEARDHGHALLAVFFVHVGEHLVAAAAADVQVNVGHVAPLLVQEALEVEPVAQRADAGDAQAVSHDGRGGRSAAHGGDALRGRVAHDVPHDQEIGRQIQLLDGLQLLLEPRDHPRRERAVALGGAFEAQLPQQREGRFPFGQLEVREDELAEVEADVGALGDFERRAHGLGCGGEGGGHGFGRAEPGIGRRGDFRRQLREQAAFADGGEHAVGEVVLGRAEVHGIGGRHGDTQRARRFERRAQRTAAVGRARFDVQTVAVNLLERRQRRERVRERRDVRAVARQLLDGYGALAHLADADQPAQVGVAGARKRQQHQRFRLVVGTAGARRRLRQRAGTECGVRTAECGIGKGLRLET